MAIYVVTTVYACSNNCKTISANYRCNHILWLNEIKLIASYLATGFCRCYQNFIATHALQNQNFYIIHTYVPSQLFV